jgi:hypothetical protein
MSANPDPEKIVITKEDLLDSTIDERLAQQRAVGPGIIQPVEEERGLRFFYKGWFYLMLAGVVGALMAWAIVEPHFEDGIVFTGRVQQVDQENIVPGIRKIVVSGVPLYVANQTTIRGGPQAQLLYTVDDLRVDSVIRVRAEREDSSGVLVAEAIRMEPAGTSAPAYLDPSAMREKSVWGIALFATLAGLVGLMVGAVEGVICHTYSRAFRCGLIGLAAGLLGGATSILIGGGAFETIGMLSGGDPFGNMGDFLLQLFRRGIAWMIAGTTAGLGQGLALKSKRLLLNGFLGGLVGGLIGGLLFDPIHLLLYDRTEMEGAAFSRVVGLGIIGLFVGLMIGITDLLTRSTWLRVTAGPLRGKEFNFYQTPIRLGSSPKNEIYLFKDPKVAPVHAVIHKLRDTYELHDNDASTGTVVNGQKIKKKRLTDGDRIQIGDSEFVYTTREAKQA